MLTYKVLLYIRVSNQKHKLFFISSVFPWQQVLSSVYLEPIEMFVLHINLLDPSLKKQ